MTKFLKLNIQLFGASASNSANLTSSAGNKATIGVSFTENSTNITNNTSNITVSGYIKMTSGSFAQYYTPTIAVYWHDDKSNTDTLIQSKDVTALSRNQQVDVGGTFNVEHKTDGTLYGYAYTVWTYTGTGSYAPKSGSTYTANTRLTDIPRATPTPDISGNIGSTITISLNRNSTSFTHTVRYAFGSLSANIATNVATSCNWTIPTTFYAQIGNNRSGTGTLYVDTYNGQTFIGTTSKTFTANVNESSAKLVVAVTAVADTDTAITALTGDSTKIVANASNAQVTFTVTSPSNASVSTLSVNGTSLSTSTRSYTINNIASQTITIVAKDSRNYTTTYTYTIPNNKWIAYVPVSITGTVIRTDGVSGHVAVNFNGNYWTGNFGSTSNTLLVQYRYQQEGGSWSNWLPSVGMAYEISGTTYQQENAVIVTGIDVNNAYSFQLRAIDKINTSGATYNVTVNRAIPVVWWNRTDFTVNNILKYTSMSQLSLEDIKKNFMELGDVMDVIKHFKVYSYNYKKEKDNERRHYGFVIPTSENSQFEVPEQLISKSNDGIDIYAMCAFLWRAVQEQQEEIEKLKVDIRTKV